MSTTGQAKLVLRKEVKQILSKMSASDRKLQSEKIVERIVNHDKFKEAKRIAIYLNMETEVQTNNLITKIFAERKKCFIPMYNSEAMYMVEMLNPGEYFTLPKTKWNIPQPVDRKNREDAIEGGGIELMILPGLAFTKCGHRIGHGKGYYDKYLKSYKNILPEKYPYTIGLAYTEQIYNDIPTSDQDVILDEVFFPGN